MLFGYLLAGLSEKTHRFIEHIIRMILSKTHHYKILLSDTDVETGSRMGGTPPQIIADDYVCSLCNGGMQYVLTLGYDTLGENIGNNELSFFVCKDFDCRWNAQAVIYPSSLNFKLHPVSKRKDHSTEMDSPCNGIGLFTDGLQEDVVDDGYVTHDYFKIGGDAGYIQSRGPDETEAIIAEGYQLLFQYSQPVFPDHIKAGTDPFGFGVAYVFAKKDPATGLMDCNNLRAFWLKT
jgi:hypothetical protein